MKAFLAAIILVAILGFIFFGAFIFTGLGILFFIMATILLMVIFFFLNILKKITKIGIIILIIVLTFLYINNKMSDESKLKCNFDSDCVCGGKDIKTNSCFIGNKEYYNFFVNKNSNCPDFCTGIANNIETRCESKKCTLQPKNQSP